MENLVILVAPLALVSLRTLRAHGRQQLLAGRLPLSRIYAGHERGRPLCVLVVRGVREGVTLLLLIQRVGHRVAQYACAGCSQRTWTSADCGIVHFFISNNLVNDIIF